MYTKRIYRWLTKVLKSWFKCPVVFNTNTVFWNVASLSYHQRKHGLLDLKPGWRSLPLSLLTLQSLTSIQHVLEIKKHKLHLHVLKNRHGTPNFWHRADDFKARHSQFWTCKCNVAPVLKILGVPRLPPRVVSARVNEARCQKFGAPCWFFSTCKWGYSFHKSLSFRLLSYPEKTAQQIVPEPIITFRSKTVFERRTNLGRSFCELNINQSDNVQWLWT